MNFAIYNSSNIGYILYWCSKNNTSVTVYYDGLLDHTLPFILKPTKCFILEAHNYHLIFTNDEIKSDVYGINHKIIKMTHQNIYPLGKSTRSRKLILSETQVKLNNVKIISTKTNKLIKLFLTAQYFYCEQKNELFDLAMSCGLPIIVRKPLAKELAKSYGFRSPIYYLSDVNEIYQLTDNQNRIILERDREAKKFDQSLRQLRPELFKQVIINSKIPKIIHFMWLSKSGSLDIPTKYNVESFLKHNKNYQIMFWNVQNVEELISNNLPQFLETYQTMTPWISKCDFARFCVIYVVGGIYSDLDFYCMKPLDGLIADLEQVFVTEPETNCELLPQLFNGFFASIAKTKFIYDWLTRMSNNVGNVLVKTGPIGLYQHYLKYNFELVPTHYVLLYDDQRQATSKLVDQNYVYTVWDEGTGWNDNLVGQAVGNSLYVGLLIFFLVLLFLIVWSMGWLKF